MTRVLIVEDHDDYRRVLTLYLSRLGYTVIQARDGLGGILQAIRVQPRLIIMDLMMPKMGGIEATARLKENAITRDIPIIVCTAFRKEAYSHSKLVEYAAEIVEKPIELEKVQELVQKYLPPLKQ